MKLRHRKHEFATRWEDAIVSPRCRQCEENTVAWWNQTYPVGTPVRYWKGARQVISYSSPSRTIQLEPSGTSRTRTPAQMLSGHTAVVWVEGEGSCIALTHVEPLEACDCEPEAVSDVH